MLRFVILTHDWPFLHWDLMLEVPDAEKLMTWRLLTIPVTGVELTAERLPDHRRLYLDYEGPVSKGRGNVTRWDSGLYENLPRQNRCLTFRMEGQKIKGKLLLNEIAGDAAQGSDCGAG